jgi:2-succinyl-5-enolpyruvyl-6-hydroxy-3-cyclohexene-1-carboxylate synthase
MDLSSNPNTHWAAVFVDHLVHAGLKHACIAPGSRSTPLTLAFALHPEIKVFTHLDERSAGFFALGLAMASPDGRPQPVALVCTSGTAAANFHPAIVEAFYAHIPLLVLTADRPPELRDSGANQTVDQVKMYGDHVLWAVDAPVPHLDAPEVVVRHLQTLAARAFATANGVTKGPVHVNFPFRKPLEPISGRSVRQQLVTTSSDPAVINYTQISRGRISPNPDQVEQVGLLVTRYRRGFIVCGPDPFASAYANEVRHLARVTGYPILADALSSMRFDGNDSESNVMGGYHTWLPALQDTLAPADVVIRFGAVATSASLNSYLELVNSLLHIHIREDGRWADDLHRTQFFIQADPAEFCDALSTYLVQNHHRVEEDWIRPYRQAETFVWETLESELSQSPFFDGCVVSRLLALLPEESILFAGNSLPIRHIDMYGRPKSKHAPVFGNRGASGIDGNVSTSLGIAAASGHHVVALIGDITFYHDMNGLLAAAKHNIQNITFVILNNNGGGIFHRLPVAQYDPPFTELFLTPHGLTFAHAAALYGLDYQVIADGEDLDEVLAWALTNSDSRRSARIIEVRTNSTLDYQQQTSIRQSVQSKLIEHLNQVTKQ